MQEQVRYATKECNRCGALYSANFMTAVSKTVSTGRSIRYSREAGYSKPSGYTDHVAYQRVLLCPPCVRRRRKGQMILWGFGGLCFATFAAIIAMNPQNLTHTSSSNDVDANDRQMPAEQAVVASSPGRNSDSDQPITAANDDAPSPVADAKSAPFESAAPSIVSDDQRFDPPAAFVPKETLQALQSGSSVIWHQGKKSGYVLVSQEQDYNDKACRSVSYSLIAAGAQIQSSPVTWCRPAGSEWVPG